MNGVTSSRSRYIAEWSEEDGDENEERNGKNQ